MKKSDKLIPEIKLSYSTLEAVKFDDKISSSQDAVTILRQIIHKHEIELREEVVVLYLNRMNKVIGYYRHSVGGISGSVFDIRLILSTALKAVASGLIVCHNHPGGNLIPSKEDQHITQRLNTAAKQLDINLLDHVILTKEGFYSFADEGNLSLNGLPSVNRKEFVYLDLFSGTGGFAKGLSLAGFRFKKHYYSEIDKFSIANYQYHFNHAQNLGDITKIQGKTIERPNLITFGSPCQDISFAGKFKGLKGKRSRLFFEAIRLITQCRPDVFIFENVKGLFSSNKGKDFEIVLKAIADIGLYDCQWQLLNTRWLLPQNRERIYLVGYLRGITPKQIFPLEKIHHGNHAFHKKEFEGKTVSPTIDTKVGESNHRSPYVLHWKGSSSKWRTEEMKTVPTINTQQHFIRNPLLISGAAYRTRKYKGRNGKLELRKDTNANQLTTVQKDSMVLFHVPEATRKGYVSAGQGDSINLAFLAANKRRGRVQKKMAGTIDTGSTQHVISRTGHKMKSAHTSLHVPALKAQANSNDPMINSGFGLRRLTPLECERLQGFPDDWTKLGIFNGEIKTISDSQRYKMLGNAVTVAVVKAVGQRLLGYDISPVVIEKDDQIKLLTLELELELMK